MTIMILKKGASLKHPFLVSFTGFVLIRPATRTVKRDLPGN